MDSTGNTFSQYMYDLLLLHLWKIKFATAMPRQFHKDTLRKKVLPEGAQNSSRNLLLFF